MRRDGIIDRFGKALALIGQAAPSFWLGIMLIFLFAVRLEWLPPSGREEPKSIILPAITIGWFFIAVNMRLIRSSMLDVLDSEYIKLARAKGASERAVIWLHALKNALIPALTFFGVSLASLIAGSITVEIVFAWPGLGRQAVTSMLASDYPVLQGVGDRPHFNVCRDRPARGYTLRFYRSQDSLWLEARSSGRWKLIPIMGP